MADRDPALPRQTPWLYRWFLRYSRKYAAKHFHAVRLSRASAAIPAEGTSLVFVVNHPAWWDVITCMILSGRFPTYRHFAPMEVAMFEKYRFFARLGFFGIDPTARGAAIFLRTAKAIFTEPGGALWVTAQGRFCDPRERPVELRPGVGGVAARLAAGHIVPVAVEYPFWDERTPECLVRFGRPLSIADGPGWDARRWTTAIEEGLTETMDGLAAEAIRRDPAAFETLVKGRVGVGGVYDRWRQLRGWFTGRRVDLAHSSEDTAEAAGR